MIRYCFANYWYYPAKSILVDINKNNDINLTFDQNLALQLFCEAGEQVLSKQEIIKKMKFRTSNENAVERIVSELRRLLDSNTDDRVFIKTLKGKGYIFKPVTSIRDRKYLILSIFSEPPVLIFFALMILLLALCGTSNIYYLFTK